ncbi:helix-turn-helix domain-containing protein [Oscillospiraceae bacterium OttesenSCG-928-F05]|nr:helix-turn-helix domain-containing protein [Oscillospiraceae bacterium OttesenSCG-928-F05]
MEAVGSRLKTLRRGIGASQMKMAAMLSIAQSSINRYEKGQAEAPYKILLWYANYFDVSMDYIFARTDKPQGMLYSYEPQTLKEKFAKEEDWAEFIEACFDPKSPMNAKMKQMMMDMMGGEKE